MSRMIAYRTNTDDLIYRNDLTRDADWNVSAGVHEYNQVENYVKTVKR